MVVLNNSPSVSLDTLKCACCDTETLVRGGFCTNCQMPLSISKAVLERGTPPRFVSILGRSGAGKTLYLGFLLDMLTKGTQRLCGLPHGSFSLEIQKRTIHALQNRRFPEKTPSESDRWDWVHCEVSHVKKPKRFVDIITPDFAGEAISLEVDNENTFPLIRSVILRSEALLVLIDSQRARDEPCDEDFFAMNLMSYVARLHGREAGGRWLKLRLPVSIVFTKSDSCPDALEHPGKFAAANLPGLVQACRRNFARCEYFAAGLVGSSVPAVDSRGRRMHVPLHIEPQGILQPLEWILAQL